MVLNTALNISQPPAVPSPVTLEAALLLAKTVWADLPDLPVLEGVIVSKPKGGN